MIMNRYMNNNSVRTKESIHIYFRSNYKIHKLLKYNVFLYYVFRYNNIGIFSNN